MYGGAGNDIVQSGNFGLADSGSNMMDGGTGNDVLEGCLDANDIAMIIETDIMFPVCAGGTKAMY